MVDCAPKDAAVSPKAQEACNSIDDDCDGEADEAGATGCSALFADEDKDGVGAGAAKCLCAKAAAFTATVDGDCNDKDPAVFPAQAEVCGNGKDDNCAAGDNDENAKGCVTFFSDVDGDGWGTGAAKCLCTPSGQATAKQAGDCNDGDSAVNPGLAEKCLDGKDNDCSGAADEVGCQGCSPFYKDADQDGFGVASDKQCLGAGKFPYTAFLGGDCDDGNANAKPGGAEFCNDVDDNCDGQIDPAGTSGCQAFYADADKDGYGAIGGGACLCKATGILTATKSGDCDDGAAAVHAGAKEACNGVDDNCNSAVDEGVLGTYFKDNDGDGWGGPSSAQGCGAPKGYVAESGDCNEFNKGIYPGAKEACNDVDDDCDSAVDQGLLTQAIYKDNDGDGFAALKAATQDKCNVPVGWTAAKDATGDGKPDWDCVDSDATTFPGAADTCGDGKDNDCDGAADKLCFQACKGAWPFKLEHTYSNIAAQPVDLDGDGSYETVVQDNFGFAILDVTGKALYQHSAPSHNYSRAPLVLADIDQYDQANDAAQSVEILSANGSVPRYYRMNADKSVTVLVGGPEVYDASKFMATDVDFDGQPEFFTSSWCQKPGVYGFRYDKGSGKIQTVLELDDPDKTCEYDAGRALTDLDGDGVTELLHGNGYGDGLSPQVWGGHIFAWRFKDAAKLVVEPFCAGGKCFDTAIAKLFSGSTVRLQRMPDHVLASVVYFTSNDPGKPNSSMGKHWRFDLQGKPLPGSPADSATLAPTDVDDDGNLEDLAAVTTLGLWDVNGDGYPDLLASSGTELRVHLWDPAKKGFAEHVPSRLAISSADVGVRGAWDMNGDGTVELVSADSNGKVFCHQLGPATWNPKSSLPPHWPWYLRTYQWDNHEPNEGQDVDGDGMPDRVTPLASAMTRKGHFYSWLTGAKDKDFFRVDTGYSAPICLTAPKGRDYQLGVWSYTDKVDNVTKKPGADGKKDGLVWNGNTGVGGTTCFHGSSVLPSRYAEFKFVVSVTAVSGSSAYWPYWLNVAK